MQLEVRTLGAKKAGTIELEDHIFGLKPRIDILHRMVRYQLAKRQSGTHASKGRSDIRGSGAKVFKQKGTGRARRGNKKAPQLRGGGKAFGPVVRSHAIALPKKVRALALRHALSAKVEADELVIIDQASSEAAKTAVLRKQFEKLGLKSALIIEAPEIDQKFSLAARNIPNIDVLPVQGLNVYDILRRHKLVLTKAALKVIEQRFASDGGVHSSDKGEKA